MTRPLYITEAQVAVMIGQTVRWLRDNRAVLEASTGFPPIDPVLNKTHLPSVEAWAQKRAERLQEATGQREPKRGNAHAF